jgi:hypothetical protein
MILRYLFAGTLFCGALYAFNLAKQYDSTGFYITSSAFALGAISILSRILLSYRGDKRQ